MTRVEFYTTLIGASGIAFFLGMWKANQRIKKEFDQMSNVGGRGPCTTY